MPDSTQQTGGTHVPISKKLDLLAEKAHALYNFFCNFFHFCFITRTFHKFCRKNLCMYIWLEIKQLPLNVTCIWQSGPRNIVVGQIMILRYRSIYKWWQLISSALSIRSDIMKSVDTDKHVECKKCMLKNICAIFVCLKLCSQ